MQAGQIVLGGASLDEPVKEGSPIKINGSVMMAAADTEEEVREIIESDIYYKLGVWDASKVSEDEMRTRPGTRTEEKGDADTE